MSSSRLDGVFERVPAQVRDGTVWIGRGLLHDHQRQRLYLAHPTSRGHLPLFF